MLSKLNPPPAIRQWLYIIFAFVLIGMIAFNIVTPEQMNDAINGAVAVVGAILTLLAAFNVDRST